MPVVLVKQNEYLRWTQVNAIFHSNITSTILLQHQSSPCVSIDFVYLESFTQCLKCNRDYQHRIVNCCFQIYQHVLQKLKHQWTKLAHIYRMSLFFVMLLLTHHFFCRSHCCEFQAYLTQSTQNDHDFCVSEQSQTRGNKCLLFFCFIYFSI